MVHFYLEDDAGSVIADYWNMPVDIDAGRRTTVNILMEIDQEDISDEQMRNLVFNATTLGMLVELEAKYMMKLIEINVNHTEEMQWEPLIQDYGIYQEGVRAESSGPQMEIVAPFFVSASEILDGQNVVVNCTLANSTSALGTDSQNITLHQYTDGELRFMLSEEVSTWMSSHTEELTFSFIIGFNGAESQQTIQYFWDPYGGW